MSIHPILSSAVLAASSAFMQPAVAADATADEATAMVKKGIAFIKANGNDAGHAEVSNRQGRFVDRDLYLTVFGLDGVVRAHGANARMVGKNMIELKDIDGKPYVREGLTLAKSQTSFWLDYKFTNPVSKKIEPKAMYCERLDDAVVCGGIYR